MKSSYDATTGSRQLELFNGERESVVLWVVDQETAKNIFLYAPGLVTRMNQGACVANYNFTFVNASRLRVFNAVGLNVVDDGAPITIHVNGTKRTNIIGWTRTQVNFFVQFIQSVDGFFSDCQFVLVEIDDGLVMMVKSMLHFMLWVLVVFQAPRLGRVFSAVWNFNIFWLYTIRKRSFVSAGLRITENPDDHKRGNDLW